MIFPEEAIRARLLASPTVFGLVGDKIQPISVGTKVQRPFIVYNRFASQHQEGMGGYTGLLMYRLQLDAFTDTYTTGKAITEAIRNCLAGFRGTITDANGSLFFHRIHIEDEREEYVQAFDASDTGIYRFLIDLSITVAESIPTLT